jgi:hypothetical protein
MNFPKIIRIQPIIETCFSTLVVRELSVSVPILRQSVLLVVGEMVEPDVCEHGLSGIAVDFQ